MKRILLAIVAFCALAFTGLLSGTAQAQGPYGYCGGHGGYGYGPHGGHPRYNVYTPRFAPYGAGYVGGWQPYQGFYYRQPRFGIYMGF